MIELCTKIPKDAIFAVSGGVDSIAAAHFLARRRKIHRIYHFNHKLQPANDEMEESVKRFANDMNCQLTLRHAEESIETEADARRLRIDDYFDQCAVETMITAHHMCDCVESYLLNVIRGHPEYVPIPLVTEFDAHKKILHPFLLNKKQTFENYACRNGLMKYVVPDPTNAIARGSRRNMILNEIIPILKREMVVLEKIVRKKLYSCYLKHLELHYE